MDSIWSKTSKGKKRPSLEGDVRTDVAVIGGGMTGILTAWQLEQAGIHTVILEADQIGGGQTKNTTVKITSQHGMFCHRFLEKKGEEKARNYVQVNQEAVKEYNRIIMEEGIDCDLTECASYVYSSDGEKLRKETEAARKLGINASFEAHIEIPVSCAGAVMFPHQAAFHPLKFLEALARNLTVYEDTMVTEVRGHQVKTSCGSVRADKIIFAAHFPFINFPGMYFARMHQERSYVIALETEERLKGMYIGDGKETLSFRQYDKYLLLGGQAHRTGENRAGGQYEELKKAAEEMYPQSRVTACWSAQDCMTADEIPFIGRYSKERPDWYVATGFQKWGMSSAMVSALLLKDMVCGIQNPYEDVFAPSRFSAEELTQIIKDSGKAVKGLTKRFFHLPGETAAELLRGHGAVADTPQGKAGVYKTEEGKLCQVNLVCPHMGCELNWNPEELTWDCSCHGSRFDREGNLIDGPAREGTVAVIPAVHLSSGKGSCSVQVITPKESLYREFPLSQFRINRTKGIIQIGDNLFSRKGIRLRLEAFRSEDVSRGPGTSARRGRTDRNKVSVRGTLRFGEFAVPKYDIMGPFVCIPGMECRHAVYSMKHTVKGWLSLDQEKIVFQRGLGYMEGDSGTSFPDKYIWTQHFIPGGSIMIAAASIPLAGMHFTGCVGFLYGNKKEYRFATYLGASVKRMGENELLIRQGRYRLFLTVQQPGKVRLGIRKAVF